MDHNVLFEIYVGLFLSVCVGFAIVWLWGGRIRWTVVIGWARLSLLYVSQLNCSCEIDTEEQEVHSPLLLLFVRLSLPIDGCLVKRASSSIKLNFYRHKETKAAIEWKKKFRENIAHLQDFWQCVAMGVYW